MADRLIAIGDIHGCDRALRGLIRAISPDASDTLVFLGDFIDRGPNPRQVVETILQLQDITRVVAIKGNHEEMLEAVIQQKLDLSMWLKYGGLSTLDSYDFVGELDFLPAAHAEFFANLRDYFEQDNFFFAHAAYDPRLPLAEQPWEELRWHSLRDEIPAPHVSGKTAILGHTANPTGDCVDLGHLICIDTFCYGGGFLTALDVHRRAVWQAKGDGTLR